MPFFRRYRGRRKPTPLADTIAGAVFIPIALGVLIWQSSWLTEAFRGPRSIEESELAGLSDSQSYPRDYLVYTPSEHHESSVGVRKGSPPKRRFHLLRTGGDWLIAVVPPGHGGAEYPGYLQPLPSSGEPLAADIEQVRKKNPSMNVKPFILAVNPDQRAEAYALLATVVGFLLFGTVLLLFGLRRLRRRNFDLDSLDSPSSPS